MGEISEIASELRDEVLQTILAVRLSLAYSATHNDLAGMRDQSAEAQEHLATEARRLRALIDRLATLADELEADAEAPPPRLRLLP
jgi:hypothetical protein